MHFNYAHISPFLIFFNILSAPFFAIFRNSKANKNIFLGVSIISFALTIVNLYCVINNGPIVYRLGGWEAHSGIAFKTNSISALMLVILSTGFLISSFGIRQNVMLPGSVSTYSCILLGSLIGCCVTADFFNTYVFVELSSIACYVLITMNTNNNRSSYKVAFDYLVIASFAGGLILLGILAIYVATGSLSMITIASLFRDTSHFDLKTLKLLRFGYIFLTIGFLIKTGFFPLYTWLVKTYATSLSSVSGLMASVVTKVFVFLIYKNNLLFRNSPILYPTMVNAGLVLFVFAAVGMVVLGVGNIGQGNIKKEIAISSAIQVCYFVMSSFVFSHYATVGFMLQMFAHSLCCSTLFLILDESFYTIDAGYTPQTTREIPKYLITRSPITKFAFIVLILNVVAYPATTGFASKWALFRGFLDVGGIWQFATVIIAGAIGLVYGWGMIERIVFFEHHHHEAAKTVSKQSWILKVISILAVILTVSSGVFIFKKPFEEAGLNYGKYF